MIRGLEYLANHLLWVSTGQDPRQLDAEIGDGKEHFSARPNGVQINLKHGDGKELWDALETPFLIVRDAPRISRDIVVDDMLPLAKRVTLTVALWKKVPTLQIVVDRPFAGRVGGPFSTTYGLEFAAMPSPLTPRSLDLPRWLRGVLMAVYPAAPREHMRGETLGPTTIPFVDAAWPSARFDPRQFGIDELRVTTHYDPQRGEGAVEAVDAAFSTPESIKPPPLPAPIRPGFVFEAASPEGFSVELHFGPVGQPLYSEAAGAILLTDMKQAGLTALPLEWSSKVPNLLSGTFEADEDSEDPPFLLGEVAATMHDLSPILAGLEEVPIHRAELGCELDTGRCDLTVECQETVEIAGLRCDDLLLTFKWKVGAKVQPSVTVLRAVAELDAMPTYFRVATVYNERWIAALEANHSSQTWAEPLSLVDIAKRLRQFSQPERLVPEASVEPTIVRLDEQRRGSESDFDELVGD